ncbi:hypothetical protein Y032_0180g814 [Ancylostoma ceylanicum]|uniref:Uncharacterized protein n=1 Tax=Ancylostoma ceylanicum TaxID=53326 RepID=A0A016SSZ3_9BILA|nr:hypothetical protein Y032_0180g814 [Ancylostoma ceylanicum]
MVENTNKTSISATSTEQRPAGSPQRLAGAARQSRRVRCDERMIDRHCIEMTDVCQLTEQIFKDGHDYFYKHTYCIRYLIGTDTM